MERVGSLFAPFNIRGKLPLRNRIVLAPLYLAWDRHSAEFRAFYVRRAEGGVGLVIARNPPPAGGTHDLARQAFHAALDLAPECDVCREAPEE